MNIDENYPYLYKANYEKVRWKCILRNKCRRRKTIALCSNDKSRRKIVYIGYKDSNFIKELKEIESILTEYKEWCFKKYFKKLNKRLVFFIFLL